MLYLWSKTVQNFSNHDQLSSKSKNSNLWCHYVLGLELLHRKWIGKDVLDDTESAQGNVLRIWVHSLIQNWEPCSKIKLAYRKDNILRVHKIRLLFIVHGAAADCILDDITSLRVSSLLSPPGRPILTNCHAPWCEILYHPYAAVLDTGGNWRCIKHEIVHVGWEG